MLIGLSNDEGESSLSQIAQLKRQGISHIVVLSERFHRDDLLCAIGAGVDAYLIKNDISSETLVKALELVSLGASVFPQGCGRIPNDNAAPSEGKPSQTDEVSGDIQPCVGNPVVPSPNSTELFSSHRPVRLSDREQAILTQLTRGASNKHIARALNIAEATVKVHVKSILRKLCVQNRTQAAMLAFEAAHNRQTSEMKMSSGGADPRGEGASR